MELVLGNIFVRPNTLNKGEITGGHTHNFDHATFVTHGSFHAKRWQRIVNEDGSPKMDGWLLTDERDLHAGDIVLIKAEMKHSFEALEDDSRYSCIFSHRDPQSGEVVLNYNGWREASL